MVKLTLVLIVCSFLALSGAYEAETGELQESPRLLPVRIEIEGGLKHRTTGAILKDIGMQKEKSQTNNHKKRVAAVSRKSHNDKFQDSDMYILKLPPNKFYYGPNGVIKNKSGTKGVNQIPVNFKSNGKPEKIYHYNLPVMRRMIARKTGNSKILKEHDANEIIKPGPIFPKEEQSLQYKKVSYYKPKKPSKEAFHKSFPGNGRPQSIYVIEESRRPASKKLSPQKPQVYKRQ